MKAQDMNPYRHKFTVLAAGAAILCVSQSAPAQDWPTRPITMVVSFAAGSGSDILGRVLGPRLAELLGRPVIIDNVGGAGGMTGALRVARAQPDGYQFGLGAAGTHAVNQTLYKNVAYNAVTDFAPVALIAEQPVVIIARKDLPPNNLQELSAYAKANQSRMQYGSPGVGSTPHLACVLLNAAMGVNVTHIPYRGAAQAMQDLIAGTIDYECATAAAAIPQIEGKAVKAIAILTKGRSSSLPNLASAHEQGFANFDAGTWYGFFLPKGTSAAIIQKLHNATIATVETPSVNRRMKEVGFDPVARERRSPEYLQKFVESEIAKWAVPIKAAGVTAE
jgi:tripartite-type tricarboxylate transporter receptor subunit TctC